MKSSDLTRELRALSEQELKQRGAKVSEELMKLRFRNKTGQLQQSHNLRWLRRERARIQTIISEIRLKAKEV